MKLAIEKETLEIIEEFLDEKRRAGKSKLTLYSYERVLLRLFSFVQKPLGFIVDDDVLRWLENNYGDKKHSTRNNRISIISSFFKFCITEDYIDVFPVKKYFRRKTSSPLPRYLERTQLAKVNTYLDKLQYRDRALISLLKSTGIRRQELVNLNVDDINLFEQSATIVGKRKRKRIVDFDEKCAFYLKKYLEERPFNHSALFLSARGRRLSTKSVYNIVVSTGQLARLNQKLWPHRFRHTFASNLVSNGADLDYIAKILGHKNRNTTKIYANLTTEELLSLYDRFAG